MKLKDLKKDCVLLKHTSKGSLEPFRSNYLLNKNGAICSTDVGSVTRIKRPGYKVANHYWVNIQSLTETIKILEDSGIIDVGLGINDNGKLYLQSGEFIVVLVTEPYASDFVKTFWKGCDNHIVDVDKAYIKNLGTILKFSSKSLKYGDLLNLRKDAMTVTDSSSLINIPAIHNLEDNLTLSVQDGNQIKRIGPGTLTTNNARTCISYKSTYIDYFSMLQDTKVAFDNLLIEKSLFGLSIKTKKLLAIFEFAKSKIGKNNGSTTILTFYISNKELVIYGTDTDKEYMHNLDANDCKAIGTGLISVDIAKLSKVLTTFKYETCKLACSFGNSFIKINKTNIVMPYISKNNVWALGKILPEILTIEPELYS